MHARLQLVLDALGYDTVKELHYKSNLIHAIQVFALVKGDQEIELACDAELESIRAQVAQQPSKK